MGPKASMILSGVNAGMKGLSQLGGQGGALQKLLGGKSDSLGLPDASSLSATGVTAKPAGPNFGNMSSQLNVNPSIPSTLTPGFWDKYALSPNAGAPKVGMNQPMPMSKPTAFPGFYNPSGGS